MPIDPPSALLDFLADHPEWKDEVQVVEINGGPEVCMTTNCTLAFAAWTKETGRADAHKADQILKGLEDAVERHFDKG